MKSEIKNEFKTFHRHKISSANCILKLESYYKQCGVSPHFSTGQIFLKIILKIDEYRHNQ